MNVTAAQVKELRERTGAGMMECKKALVEADGNMDKAIELMRKSGQAKAAKKAGRVASEGVIAIKIADNNKVGFMVEVNSETDFAARDENFLAFVEKIVNRGLETMAVDVPALLVHTITADSDQSIAHANEALVAKIGENIQIRRVALLQSKDEEVICSYCHGGRIGVMVKLVTSEMDLCKNVAMHIAASKPEAITPEDLSPDTIAKEKDIFMAQAATSGKPADIIEKMVAGKIKKFVNDISLTGQPFVKDPNMTVGELLQQSKAVVTDFVRFEVGEGIEKEETDFAAEVMAQVKK